MFKTKLSEQDLDKIKDLKFVADAIKNISETELHYMDEVYGYIEEFFHDAEAAKSFFTEEEQERFDSYVNDFGEHAVVACLVKNILEKL